MEEISFAGLAPRRGTRPMLSGWAEIGTSQMSGGAFNWGSLWSGLKNVGSTLHSWGSKAWHSNTGQALRQKLKDTNVQEKIVEGIASGIHGAIDLGRQELDKAINSRLDRPPVEEERPESAKRPREDLELVSERPPSYEEAVATRPQTRPAPIPRPRPRPEPVSVGLEKPGALVDTPTTLDLRPPASPPPPYSAPAAPAAASRPAAAAAPARATQSLPVSLRVVPSRSSRQNWQSTLNSIVGLGVRSLKRRRCY